MNSLAEGFHFTQEFYPLDMSLLEGADGVIFFLDFTPVIEMETSQWWGLVLCSVLSPVSYYLGKYYKMKDFISDSLGLRAELCTGLHLEKSS